MNVALVGLVQRTKPHKINFSTIHFRELSLIIRL